MQSSPEDTARNAAEQLPELAALRLRLQTERPDVRRAAATSLYEWVDVYNQSAPEWETMTTEQLRALCARLEAEIAARP